MALGQRPCAFACTCLFAEHLNNHCLLQFTGRTSWLIVEYFRCRRCSKSGNFTLRQLCATNGCCRHNNIWTTAQLDCLTFAQWVRSFLRSYFETASYTMLCRQRLRTSETVLRVVAKDLLTATSAPELARATEDVEAKLQGLGVYKAVATNMTPSQVHPGRYDVQLGLDEASFSLNSGAMQSLDGSLQAGLEGRLLNKLGLAETLSVKVGQSAVTLDVAAIGESGLDSLSRMRDSTGTGPSAATAAGVAQGDAGTEPFYKRWVKKTASFDPDFSIAAKFPVVAGKLMPVEARVRRERTDLSLQSSYEVRTSDVEVSATDASGSHGLGYTLARRVPQASTSGAPASQEVLAELRPDIKSSVTYSYALHGLLSGRDVGGDEGVRVRARAEVAGGPLGGDVGLLKFGMQINVASSVGRYTPDTGYALPLPRREWLEAAVRGQIAEAGGEDTPWTETEPESVVLGRSAGARKSLKPHPGPRRVFGHLISHRTDLQHNYTLWHRLAGWTAGGITAQLEANTAAVMPWWRGGYGESGRPRSVGIVDRLVPAYGRIRGWEGVGPHAAPVPGALTRHGDALGGDLFLAATGRVLLPPPIPSVRMANAFFRSTVWSSVGLVQPWSALAGSALPHHSLWAGAAGVGLTWPLQGGLGIELDWVLASVAGDRSGAKPLTRGVRLCLSQ